MEQTNPNVKYISRERGKGVEGEVPEKTERERKRELL